MSFSARFSRNIADMTTNIFFFYISVQLQIFWKNLYFSFKYESYKNVC